MGIRVGINGFGRIGRLAFRAMLAHAEDFDVVAVNDLAPAETLRVLTKYDSVHGPCQAEVSRDGDNLIVDGAKIRVLGERDPAKLPWAEEKVDVVLESTGVFRDREALQKHLDAGAPVVILSAPPKDELDAIVVTGVNDDVLTKEHKMISNASCTTNCLAPLAMVLDDSFGIEYGLMTTCHAYTNDQRINDLEHKDLRRARAAAINIIPTTTGAARAVGKVLPGLNGKLDGMSLRVPVADGSIVDLTAVLGKDVTVESVNAAVKAAADGPLKGILQYTDDPIVSSDVVGNSHSSVFDSLATIVIRDRMVKVLSWYDNEWGYSCRTADLMAKVAKL